MTSQQSVPSLPLSIDAFHDIILVRIKKASTQRPLHMVVPLDNTCYFMRIIKLKRCR